MILECDCYKKLNTKKKLIKISLFLQVRLINKNKKYYNKFSIINHQLWLINNDNINYQKL